jgi:RNA polymerase sigma factor (sigma-70 family)
MLSKPVPSPEIFRSLEAAFIEHYDWLLRWALQFTNNDHERAKDLVQQVFAQFAMAHTDLSAVQNIPAYLYATLRNTHLSEVRLAGRSHGESLSVVEYSIADAALGGGDPSALFQTQEQLRRVCQYACLRKQSSRAGSVLILRFFHGYHISEIAAVLGATCQAVRQSLKFARNEARLYLENPGALKFISRTQLSVPFSGTVCTADELLAELRRAIFCSCQGECLDSDSLRELYAECHIVAAENATLAHIVSCAKCLDAINWKLGLPLLAERHAADALGPNNNWRGGPGSSGTSGLPDDSLRSKRRAKNQNDEISSSILLKCRRRATELFEHHPRELCISVNGYVLGSQSVNSGTSRLRLDVAITEPLSFIEVIGDERTRLLVMTIDPPPHGEPTQERRVLLSEGRHIDVTLRYGHPWPMLEVVYEDPNFIAESQLSMSDVDGLSEWNPAKDSSSLTAVVEAGAGSDQLRSKKYRRYGLGKLLTRLRRKHVSASRQEKVAGPFDFSVSAELIRRSFWSNPGFITVILSLFLIGALLFVRLNLTPTVTAANLIEQASAAEEVLTKGTDHATHRVINLEERAQAGGDPIDRSRIEIWRDTSKGLSVRRVYDEKGHLIAGEWSKHHAVEGKANDLVTRTIYQRGQALRIEPSAGDPHAAIRNLELWQLEPSAKGYGEVIAHAEAASVSETPVAYVVSYTSHEASGDGALLQATLILRKSDLHPIEQVLSLKQGGDTRTYRFVETSFERPSVNAVTPTVYELDSELVSDTKKAEGERLKRDNLAASSLIPHPSAVASAELEIEVAYLLDQYRTRFGDQISLTRAADGSLKVQGTVTTEESKKEILQTLATVSNNPAVKIQISTAAEVLARQQGRSSERLVVQEFAGSDSAIPVYGELRSYLSQHGDDQGRVDEAVRVFAARVVSRSRRALSHAIELKQLSERFSVTQVDALTPSARSRLLSMIRGHAEALRRETSQLRGDLQPIFFATESGNAGSESGEISIEAGLAPAIERLYKLVLANDAQIRSSFAASSNGPATGTMKAPRFRLSLVAAERLADRIQQAAAKG